MRDAVFTDHRIWLLFILLAHVCPDLRRFRFEQPPSILLRLLDSWISARKRRRRWCCFGSLALWAHVL